MNLEIFCILSIRYTDARIPQFLNPLIPKSLNYGLWSITAKESKVIQKKPVPP